MTFPLPRAALSGTDGGGADESPRPPRALIVDDAEGMRAYLATLFESRGFEVDTCEEGGRALKLLENGADPDVILLDVMMPGIDGLAALARIKKAWPEVPVLMVSVVGKAGTIVEAIQLGAADYLTKPFEEAELDGALDRLGLHSTSTGVARELGAGIVDPSRTVWVSPAMCGIREVVEQIGDTDVTVLIQGESGAGKEVVAREVHAVSNRSSGPFVKVNCAALPTQLLESELFGYEKGAFTGANGRKQGKFELAHGGTIFLDEIGEMPLGLQAKLLRVLQERKVRRVGGTESRPIDIRLVSSASSPLFGHVDAQEFRSDLYYRIAVLRVQVPPLRERLDDVPELVRVLVGRHCGDREVSVSPEAMVALRGHGWPGNVRGLENALRAALVIADRRIDLKTLPIGLQPRDGGASGVGSLKTQVAMLETKLIEAALLDARGNQTDTERRISSPTQTAAR